MKLGGLVLHTQYFEDYLSFLTEVLELELTELTDVSMKLSLSGSYLEIKKIPSAPSEQSTTVVFELNDDDYEDLISKLSFFFYRRGPSRFLLLQNSSYHCELSDPDGRVWRFETPLHLQQSLSYQAQV
ncbi:MAG: hypothetical protein WCY48_08300 [Candidatus Caldatribacteriota bacterium]